MRSISSEPAPVDPYAMPMLAVAETWNASSRTGSCSAAMMRSATSIASLGSASASISTANSSPPSRAAVSPARRQLVSRSLTTRSSASPAEWPRLSFTVLKSSRSMNSTASCPPLRWSRVAAWSTRSRNSAWFASPVNGSWNAWCVSSFWSRRCSVTSRKLHTRPTTSPSMCCGSESRSNTRPSLNSSEVVTVRLGLFVEPLHLGRRTRRVAELLEHGRERAAVVARLEHLGGTRHISAKRLFQLVMRPAPSTTRMPSAVDSSVAASTEFASRSSVTGRDAVGDVVPGRDESLDGRDRRGGS